MAAFFARAFFEPALAAIGSNIVESAGAGLSVGAGSVGAGLVDAFITSLIFGTGVPVGGSFGNLDAFLEGEGGQLAAFLLRARGRGIVGWWGRYSWRWLYGQNFREIFLMGFR